MAFLFGCERFGMANDDVYRCHVALSIPTAPDYGSLNLAAAVQLGPEAGETPSLRRAVRKVPSRL